MILYLGDTSLTTAAAYLAGVMHHAGLAFRYHPSDQPTTAADIPDDLHLVVLSDYMARMLEPAAHERIVQRVEVGMGLLMLGGWESFGGLGGDWAGTPVGDILPVHITAGDDRVNCPQPAMVRPVCDHPIVAGLPWHEPPVIGGFNQFRAKEQGTVVLEVERYRVRAEGAGQPLVFEVRDRQPLLVVGEHGRGRVAALATDVAPHWVGGMVDWGDNRVTARAEGSIDIEVGSAYAKLFEQLLRWTAGE